MTTSTELTLPQRAKVALASTETEKQLRELVAASADVVAVADQAGRDMAHRIGMNLKNARTAITKIGKAAREDAQAFSKAVIAEEKRLVDIIEVEEGRVFGLRDEWDTEQKRIADEKAAADRARLEAIERDIGTLRTAVTNAAGKDAAGIADALAWVREQMATEDRFAELRVQAAGVRAEAIEKLTEMHSAALAREEAAAAEAAARETERQRIAAEQAELARQRAEQAEQARVIAEQQAALRREQEAVAEAIRHQQEVAATKARADEAARQRVIAAEVAERKRQDDERAAAIEKQAAELRAAQEAFAAQQRAVEEAKAAAIDLERAHAEALELNAAWQPPAPPAAEPEPVAVAAPLPDTEPTDLEIIRAYQESFGGTEAQCVERLARFTAQYLLEAA